ncbi:MAG: ribosome silencing factor [Clostridia bacterium]|nr:ribosome silencing factor [Clostridia bacterium]MCR4886622.1 ribosome silencing factor [Clostridiales bacterium]
MENNGLALRIAKILYDKKALDITVLHVGHLTVITDYMVIASGRSSLQVKALADDVDDALAEDGVALRAREGQGEGRWIVLDYGTVLVHIFHPEDRQFYHLERLWEDGQNRIPLPFEEAEQKPGSEANA